MEPTSNDGAVRRTHLYEWAPLCLFRCLALLLSYLFLATAQHTWWGSGLWAKRRRNQMTCIFERVTIRSDITGGIIRWIDVVPNFCSDLAGFRRFLGGITTNSSTSTVRSGTFAWNRDLSISNVWHMYCLTIQLERSGLHEQLCTQLHTSAREYFSNLWRVFDEWALACWRKNIGL